MCVIPAACLLFKVNNSIQAVRRPAFNFSETGVTAVEAGEQRHW